MADRSMLGRPQGGVQPGRVPVRVCIKLEQVHIAVAGKEERRARAALEE